MSWLPEGFLPPRSALLRSGLLEVLAERHQDLDFRAVRRSAETIRGVFGPHNAWPSSDLTEAENLDDLRRHASEFEMRKAFAYAIRCTAGRDYLGCLYLKPIKSREPGMTEQQRRFAAQAFVWFDVGVADVHAEALATELRTWVATAWPWPAVAWPGREPDWAAWQRLSSAAIS